MAARKKNITINGKKYPVKEFDYNLVCDLEDMGFNMEDVEKKPMSMVRAYAGICMDVDVKEAGKELGLHLKNGGDFNEIMSVISDEMEYSDFFQDTPTTEEA